VDFMGVGLEVIKRAFFIVTGYFLAKLGVGFLGKAVPQIASFGNFGVLALAIVGAGMTSGLVQELFMGAAILGAVNIVDSFLSPVLTSTIGAVIK